MQPNIAPIILGLCTLLSISACDGGRTLSTMADDVGMRSHAEDSPSTVDPSQAPSQDPIDEGVWLKGDLHLHSDHSADATAPLAELVAAAEAVGMDYFMTTDHDNHVNGDLRANTWADPDYRSSSMVMLYGAEWTTHRGHANTIAAQPYDHASFYALRDALDTDIAAKAQELGFHLSANHPDNADSFSFSYDMIDSVEVWNSAIWSWNTGAVTIWDDLLKSGRPLTARGGSDAHHSLAGGFAQQNPNGFQELGNYVGTPTTWIYAQSTTADAVVRALTYGRASISANPYSERVELTADVNGDDEDDLMMGDIALATGAEVRFRIRLEGGQLPANHYVVSVVKNGAELMQMRSAQRQFEFRDTPDNATRSYYRVMVQGLVSPYPEVPLSSALSLTTLAISNPIYFNFKAPNRD